MVWTRFWDMSSGGSDKEEFECCYIEAPEAEACQIFYNRFGHNPYRVSCTCCGADYAVSQNNVSLQQATAFQRHCAYDNETKQYVEKVDHIYEFYGSTEGHRPLFNVDEVPGMIGRNNMAGAT